MNTVTDVADFLKRGNSHGDWERAKAHNTEETWKLDNQEANFIFIIGVVFIVGFALLTVFWQPPAAIKVLAFLLTFIVFIAVSLAIHIVSEYRRRPYRHSAAGLQKTWAKRVAVVVAEFYEAPNRPFVVVRPADGRLTFCWGTLANLQKEPLLQEIGNGSRPASVKTVKCRSDLQDQRLLMELCIAVAVTEEIEFGADMEFPQIQQAVQAFLASAPSAK